MEELMPGLMQYIADECTKIDMNQVITEYREKHKAELDAHRREIAQLRYVCSLFEKK